ncbi:MAG: S8 family serine peptidase, partial [Candidatus Woesearchaeota archaeon]
MIQRKYYGIETELIAVLFISIILTGAFVLLNTETSITGYTVFEGSEWENVIKIKASPGQEVVTQNIVFGKYKPKNCKDGILVTTEDGDKVNYKIINSTYYNDTCLEAKVQFYTVFYEYNDTLPIAPIEPSNKTIKENITEDNDTFENITEINETIENITEAINETVNESIVNITEDNETEINITEINETIENITEEILNESEQVEPEENITEEEHVQDNVTEETTEEEREEVTKEETEELDEEITEEELQEPEEAEQPEETQEATEEEVAEEEQPEEEVLAPEETQDGSEEPQQESEQDEEQMERQEESAPSGESESSEESSESSSESEGDSSSSDTGESESSGDRESGRGDSITGAAIGVYDEPENKTKDNKTKEESVIYYIYYGRISEPEEVIPTLIVGEKVIITGTNFTYEKLEEDPDFNVYLSNVTIINNTLTVSFYHDSNRTQPVEIIGNVTYILNVTELTPNTTALLIVNNWTGEYFELKVGSDSEIISFGKKQNTLTISLNTEKKWYYINETINIFGEVLYNEKPLNNNLVTLRINEEQFNLTTDKGKYSYNFSSNETKEYNLEAFTSHKGLNSSASKTIFIYPSNYSLNASIEIKSINYTGLNWTIIFNTNGLLELRLTPDNITKFGDHYEVARSNLKVKQFTCGNETIILNKSDGSLFHPAYECSEKGILELEKLIPGTRSFSITFGNDTEYITLRIDIEKEINKSIEKALEFLDPDVYINNETMDATEYTLFKVIYTEVNQDPKIKENYDKKIFNGNFEPYWRYSWQYAFFDSNYSMYDDPFVYEVLHKDFLESNMLEMNEILMRTLYCKEKEITPEIFDYIVKDWASRGDYDLTHAIMALMHLRERGCYDQTQINSAVELLINMTLKEQKSDDTSHIIKDMDIYAERADFILINCNKDIQEEWIIKIIESQNYDGGWPLHTFRKESDTHSTFTSLFALWPYREYILENKSCDFKFLREYPFEKEPNKHNIAKLKIDKKVKKKILEGNIDKLIVKYSKEESIQSINSEVLSDTKILKNSTHNSKTYTLLSGKIDKDKLNDLINDKNVKKIYIDEKVNVSSLDNLEVIRFDKVKEEFNLTGEGIRICVIDTGVDSSINYSIGYDFVNDDPVPEDNNGHGTVVTSIIKTISPKSELIIGKVVNDSGIGYYSDVIEGLEYCIQNNADIISISLNGNSYTGFCDEDILAEESNNAYDESIFVIAASGNDGSSNLRSPSCGSKVFSVGATDNNDIIATFSNVNPTLDSFAPGVKINTSLGLGNGTSLSVPHVSGATALLLEKEALNLPDIKYRLRSTGKPILFNYINENISLSESIGLYNRNRKFDKIKNPNLINISRLDLYNLIINNKTHEPYDYSWFWQSEGKNDYMGGLAAGVAGITPDVEGSGSLDCEECQYNPDCESNICVEDFQNSDNNGTCETGELCFCSSSDQCVSNITGSCVQYTDSSYGCDTDVNADTYRQCGTPGAYRWGSATECSTCATCSAGTGCQNRADHTQDNVGSNTCTTECEECDGTGNCASQDAGQDYFNQCNGLNCNVTEPKYYFGWSSKTCFLMANVTAADHDCNGTGYCYGRNDAVGGCPDYNTQDGSSGTTCNCVGAQTGCTGTTAGSCGNCPPNATMNSPGDNTVINSSIAILNITIEDSDSDYLNVTFYNNATDTAISGCTLNNEYASGSEVICVWYGLSPGEYQWYVNTTDGTNINKSNVLNYSTTDYSIPSISPVNPTPGIDNYTNKNWVYLNITTSSSNSNVSSLIDWNKTLVGYWSFDYFDLTSVMDNSSYSNHGNFSGTSFDKNDIRIGKYGHSLKFDGDDDYVNCSDDSSLNLIEQMSVFAWIKYDAVDSNENNYIVSRCNGSSDRGYSLFLQEDSGNVIAVAIIQNDTDSVTVNGSTILSAGTWYHLGFISNGTNITLYVNGKKDGSEAEAASIPSENQTIDLIIGIYNSLAPQYAFNGTIDEVQIHNRALSPEEINASYNNEKYRLETNITSLSEGTYTYRIYSIDDMNDSEERNVTVDTTSPLLTVHSPSSNQVLTLKNISINITVIEQNINYTNIIITNGSDEANETNVTTTGNFNVTRAVKEYGTYNITVTSYDKAGNTNQSNITNVIITIGALISWVSPTPGDDSYTRHQWVYLNTTRTDFLNSSAFFDWNYSLVGYWSFEYNSSSQIYDNSTYDNHGTFEGVSTKNITTGKYGDAMDFDAKGCLNVSDSTELRLTENFTIEFWVKMGGPQTQEYILVKGVDTDNNDYAVLWNWSSVGEEDQIAFFAQGYTGDNPRTDSNITISDTNWHHIAYVYNSTDWLGYRDGENVFSLSKSFTLDTSAGKLSIGSADAVNPGNNRIDATLDEVRIYKRALSEAEINASYNNETELYNNFTQVKNGSTYDYTAYTITESGLVLITTKRNVTVDTDKPTVTTEKCTANDTIGTIGEFARGTVTINATVADTLAGLKDNSCKYNISISGLDPASWGAALDNFEDNAASGVCNYTWDTTSFTDGTNYTFTFMVNDTVDNNANDSTPEWVVVCNELDTKGNCSPPNGLNPSVCEQEGYIWFVNVTAGGSNDPCCGDDAADDDFWLWNDTTNNCTYCNNSEYGYQMCNDSGDVEGTGSEYICYYDEGCSSSGANDGCKDGDNVSKTEAYAGATSAIICDNYDNWGADAGWCFNDSGNNPGTCYYSSDLCAADADGWDNLSQTCHDEGTTNSTDTRICYFDEGCSSSGANTGCKDGQNWSDPTEIHSSLADGCDYGNFSDTARGVNCSETGTDICYAFATEGCAADDDGWDYNAYDCDNYDVNDTNGWMNESEINTSSCTKDCTGRDCCEIQALNCSPTNACEQAWDLFDDGSSAYNETSNLTCYMNNSGFWDWNATAHANETSCADLQDNDCDGNADGDDPDCQKECGDFLNVNTDLVADITDCEGIILQINASNIILDCHGYYLKSTSNSKPGINNTGFHNVTIKNCEINMSHAAGSKGIYYKNADNGTIRNNTITAKEDYAIYTNASSNNLISNNTLKAKDDYALYIYSGSNNTISENNLTANGSYAIALETSLNNTISNNTLKAISYAIILENSNNNTLSDNIYNVSNLGGIYIHTSYENTISGGSVIGKYEFMLRNSGSNNTFRNVNFTGEKEIYFNDATERFNYNNDSTGGVWLNTSINETGTNITRELFSWDKTVISWNDTPSTDKTEATYNISGLYSLTDYIVYNNSDLVDTLTTDINGKLPGFQIRLKSEHNITVEVKDTSEPVVSWVSPTPSIDKYTNDDWVYLNTTIADESNISSFFDWNYSLVGYWSFDYTNNTHVKDNSTYGHHGEFKNGSNPDNLTIGKYGNALEFDGVDDYVDCGDFEAGTFDGSNTLLTVEAFIKMADDSPEDPVVAKYNNLNNNKTFYLLITATNNISSCVFKPTEADNYYCEKTGPLTFNDKLHHVVTTINLSNSDRISIYYDGIEQATSNETSGTPPTFFDNNNHPVDIGSMMNEGGGRNFFNGTIDEVRIYNKILSPKEINASYNNETELYNNFTSLSDGTYNYTAYSIDEYGNLEITSTRNVTVDQTNPLLTINKPVDNGVAAKPVKISLTVTEAYINYTNIIITNGSDEANATNSTSTGTFVETLDVPSFGFYNITATAYDKAGNTNQSNVTEIEVNTETIESKNDTGKYSSVAIDSNGVIHMSYYNSTGGDLKHCNGTEVNWDCETVETSGDVGSYSSIAIDSNDVVHISHFNNTDDDLRYCNNSGGSWSCENVKTAGFFGAYTSIAIDSNDAVHISFNNGSSSALSYCNNTGGSWTCDNVDTTEIVGWYTSIAIDSNNVVHISHYNVTGLDLRYCNNTGGSWTCDNIKTAGVVGCNTSIEIDLDDVVNISLLNLST